MDLSANIEKIRQVPVPDDNALFIRRQGYNENRVFRKPKTPPNAHLFDLDNDTKDRDGKSYNSVPQEILHEEQIASAIQRANCRDYSNETTERHWEKMQREASSVHNRKDLEVSNIAANGQTSSELSTLESSKSKEDIKENVKDEENILKQCKLNKNAVIRGLLKQHLITVNDLVPPADAENKDSDKIESASASRTNNQTNFVQLVACPEDPDVLVQPLQAYGRLDENKYKDIDFTVPRVGIKKTVTARQYYINIADSDFDFVKK